MEKNSRIYIAGRYGMVGKAIARHLRGQGFTDIRGDKSKDLDLTNQKDVLDYFEFSRPEYVFLAAAKVGGIHANSAYPASFIYSNLCIQTNIIQAAHQYGVKKLLFLGSSCIYPKFAEQPILESALLSGPLEPTNEPYAIAKIAGIKMCQAYNRQYGTRFISCMPTNLYGLADNYNPMNAHVLPALLRRFHEAAEEKLPIVTVWGTGEALREFLFVEDLAAACALLMDSYEDNEPINIGSGEEISIHDLSLLIAKVVGYKGIINFDRSKPDGTPRKLLDISKIRKLGWAPSTKLKAGLEATYRNFLSGRVRK